MSLPPCCRFHPAEVKVPRRSDFGTPCCLRPSVAGSALGSTHFRGHIHVHCRYGPVIRDLPTGDLVDGLQGLGFPLPCHPNYGASDSLPRRVWLPLNTPAFTGHTTGLADFPHPALGQDFTPSRATPSAVSEHSRS